MNVYQLNELQYHYADKLALSIEYLEIQAGKTTALVGANGSGKSSLLHLLAFLQSPSRGDLLFKGQRVERKELTFYRRRVGFLAQKPFMLRGTVYENIALALKIHGKSHRSEKIHSILTQLNIYHCVNQQAKLLSGGELQKVALARVLVLEPEILLLDEPFSYLDQSSTQDLELFLQTYTQATGHTLVFSTHDRLQGFALSDEIVALADGKQVQTPLINLFHGRVIDHVFHSGCLQIILTGNIEHARHASINPEEIVLSIEALASSMRNHFQGRVVVIADEMGKVRVNVDTGVIFQVLITYQAFDELHIKLGDPLWVNFKSNSVVVF